MLEKEKEKTWKKMEKGKFQKSPENNVFWVFVKKTGLFFVKMSFFREIGKHYLCSEGQKSAHFRCNYLFLENGPFLVPIQSHQTLQK